MVSISACHAEDPGSIPSRDVVFNKVWFLILILCGSLDCIVVSTSVCGTESSDSNPDRDLLFDFDRLSMSERTFYFFFFFLPGNEVVHCITFPFLLSKTIFFLFSKDRFVSAEYSFRLENPLPI